MKEKRHWMLWKNRIKSQKTTNLTYLSVKLEKKEEGSKYGKT